jgi:hypothetical protein
MVIFHSYVSSPEGNTLHFVQSYDLLGTKHKLRSFHWLACCHKVFIGKVFSVGWTPCRAVKAGECYMVRGDFCQDAQVDPMKS